ncbi:MAG: alpha/beta hydrolase [Proteobacteria bacterium]|nr:alpha/beta hydrolase [Pseudomonadota bacterium]
MDRNPEPVAAHDAGAGGKPARGAPGMEQPQLRMVDVAGLPLAAFEWRAERRGHGPSIVLVHATGFHARCWDRIVRLLPGVHVLAIELRGHGRSGSRALTHWRELGADLASAGRQLGVRDALWVGHSAGGHVATVAVAAEPSLCARLILIDPVIFAPEAYARGWNPMAPPPGQRHPVARRRSDFASADEMVEVLRARPPYSQFDAATLRDYCAYGLKAGVEGGGLELCCAPSFEAGVYETGASNVDIYAAVGAIRVPVTVVRAKEPTAPEHYRDFAYSPTWPGLAGVFAAGRDLPLPDLGHMIPMLAPERTATLIGAEASALAAART